MASSKEIQHSSRPLSQHRLSMSTNSGSLPKSHARNHSHSVSSGSLITSHRVTRRKSVSSNANVAAMVAAVREAGDTTLGIPISNRRNTMSKNASARSTALGSLPSPPASLPGHRIRLTSTGKSDRSESAIDDDQNDDEMDDNDETAFKQSRMRRASEGQHLMKEKKSNGSELRCEKCGKGYKHSSCLSKHLWEHTPEWGFTSKLLISKHQQVQLLEAASVLLTMNQNSTTPPGSAKDFQSDQDSASPAASSSEQQDGTSSADTTPPPPADMFNTYSGSYTGRHHKRYSSGNTFSRSYQSTPSANLLAGGSVPSGTGFGHYRQPSGERRPLSSGFSRNQEDDGLAAAVELLSCSFGSTGTPRAIPVTLENAPPVPTIPTQYLSQSNRLSGSTLTPSQHPRQTESYTRNQVQLDGDIKMEEESIADDDEDDDQRSRGRSDEDDDGVFGRMEE